MTSMNLSYIIMGSGTFYSRLAQRFVTRFAKALENKGRISVPACCGEMPKKSWLVMELNDQKL